MSVPWYMLIDTVLITLTAIMIILRGVGLPNKVGGGNKFSRMPDVTIRNNGAA